MFFRLKEKVGNHAETDPKTGLPIVYKPGDVIESDTDLAKNWPDKFDRVKVGPSEDTPDEDEADIQAAAEEGAKDVTPPDEDEDEDFDDEEEEKVPLGKDVTEKFPRAEEEELKVFYKKGKGFFVTETEDPFTALNEKKLKKAQVEDFIDEYLDDEE